MIASAPCTQGRPLIYGKACWQQLRRNFRIFSGKRHPETSRDEPKPLSRAVVRNFHFWRAEHTGIGGEIIENP